MKVNSRRLDFLVISPAKTGSTWLNDILDRHAETSLAFPKEPHYFSRYWGAITLGEYMSLFPPGGRLRGDVSTDYYMLPCERIAKITRLWPRIRVIAILREPAARMWSHVRFWRPELLGETAVEQLRALRVYATDTRIGATMAESLHVPLRRWLDYVPRERFFITSLDDIVDPESGRLNEVFEFLGVAPPPLDRERYTARLNENGLRIAPLPVARAFMEHALWDARPGLTRLVEELGIADRFSNWNKPERPELGEFDAPFVIETNRWGRDILLYKGWYVAVDVKSRPPRVGFDGELIEGDPSALEALRRAVTVAPSVVRTEDGATVLKSRFHVTLKKLIAAWTGASERGRARLADEHAADLLTTSLDDVIALVTADARTQAPLLLRQQVGGRPYNALYFKGLYLAVPQSLSSINWRRDDVAAMPGVFIASTLKTLERLVAERVPWEG